MEDTDHLISIPWFASLDAAMRRHLIDRGRWQKRRIGEWVHGEGDEETGVVAVIEGRLNVHAQAPGGREVLFSVLQPGDLFGQSTVFGGGPRLLTYLV